MRIRNAELSDAGQIAKIYNYYIRNTAITFEETLVTAEEISRRISKTNQSGLPWLVAETDGEVLGYAYAAKWHERSAYRFTVESSIYILKDATGKGLGKQLYHNLIESLHQQDIHNILGVIALPNKQSVGLHEKFGFKKMGELPHVGFKFGKWISVGFWQLELMPDTCGASFRQ